VEDSMMIKIQSDPINIAEVLASVQNNQSGAVNIFLGTVRNHNKEKKVIKLAYEAYDSMAVSEIRKIVEETQEKWPVEAISVVHRKGELHVGDIAVMIAVAAPHRKESFAACEYIIDTLKKRVPIWKKEYYPDGDYWLDAHP